MQAIFQVGILVKNLENAMEELTQAQNVRWGAIANRQYNDWKFRRVFSMEGPPYIELIEGPPGSPWDCGGASKLEHLQWWTDDMEADTRRFLAAGLTIDTDGVKLGGPFRYFRGPATGMRYELIDSAQRARYKERWGIEAAAQSTKDG